MLSYHPIPISRNRHLSTAVILLSCLLTSASIFILSTPPTAGAAIPSAKSGGGGLALDGSNTQGCGHSTNSCSTTLTTSHANDIVLVYTFESLDLQTSCTFSVQDSAGLVWHLRGSVSGRNDGTTGSNRDQNAEFWAQAAHPLASDTITESILGCASIQFGGEYNGVVAFGVSGANFNSPFDPNNAQAVGASGFSNSPSVNISTRNRGDMIIGVGQQSSFGTFTPGLGFTIIFASGPGGAASEFQIVRSSVTSLPVGFGDDATWYWEILADAVTSTSHHG